MPAYSDEPVRIVDYDPAWPERFEAERLLLEPVLAPWSSGGIHHVGSTAVPDLAAKPVIDILVGVGSLEGSRGAIEALEPLHYLYAPYTTHEMHWFCKPHPTRRSHHLHLVPAGSARFGDELAFRDRLRADHGAAAAYERCKRELAARFTHDRAAYTEAKAEFIRSTLTA